MMHYGMHTGGVIWMLIVGALLVIPFWKLTTRTGYPGPLALLILIPLVNLGFIYFLAFSEWPVDRRD
ncbi:hypothetical protein CK501_15130 [Halovibrio salipaludis]|uniref:DUF805 domain-containing protein n=1 Tax=Halovibrio salipaludis TaxID=2032626 RepID=A0A2A2EUF7_9GAMM|nr:hypothetical protein [Halovibrio salipaludis]PAU77051.1 hypothetical protein CK501_15130 [Halovibrio salipaludis]